MNRRCIVAHSLAELAAVNFVPATLADLLPLARSGTLIGLTSSSDSSSNRAFICQAGCRLVSKTYSLIADLVDITVPEHQPEQEEDDDHDDRDNRPSQRTRRQHLIDDGELNDPDYEPPLSSSETDSD